MFKVLIVFGTRPEAIKMAPLVLALRLMPDVFDVKVCVTAQHREMLDQVLDIFAIVPDIDLNLMRSKQELAELTSLILTGMNVIIREEKPDLVLVHGDTTTTLATSLASFYLGVKVGHVEAGLRTHNLNSPFPEELNRQIVSKIASVHFAPTEMCKSNLQAEKIEAKKIFVTGNTVIDALNIVLNKIQADKELNTELMGNLDRLLGFDWQSEKFVLVTGHRRENFGQGFIEICSALAELCRRFPSIHFVYPVHMNPNVQSPVRETLGGLGNMHLIAPMDYTNFLLLLKSCHFVLTDSGGLQEEAPSLGKPVLLMRETTERPEALKSGAIKLVGAHKNKIIETTAKLLEDESLYAQMADSDNPFGSGDSANEIVSAIKSLFLN
jgi:UDP-N-acetylglucosamine 2-epimerase (non-hydrolysing)